MREVMDQLLKAMLGLEKFTALFCGLLIIMFFGVQSRLLCRCRRTCEEAHLSEYAAGIKEACRRQKAQVKFYSILKLTVVAPVVDIISSFAAMIPVSCSRRTVS